MAATTPLFSPGASIAQAIEWLNIHAHTFFAMIGWAVETVLGAAEQLLLWPAPWLLLAAVVLVALLVYGVRYGALAAASLGLCLASGLWKEAMQTIALVSVSVTVSVLIAFPMGIWAARKPRAEAVLRPVLDIMQTVPPWVYLIPAVMIFSLGKVPALIATVVYGIPPMLRITTLAFKEVPRELIELGQASGAGFWQVLGKLEIPAARKTLLVGLNQTILLSLAMVVLAGLVGAGGLGAEVTRGLTRMEMGLGLRAGLSIVAVAILLDRLSRRALG
ncbi:ABC transporter permease subunit [Sinirhodobacter sp. WL0062]|uniref:ABC transporter permease subunit n=1 Tax=Rhodobacter flavimaris TaxID=2907145 RepID=A0ABS8Z1S4_9RHOB|nr:ABC transporter permease subunit [Sinirhodobacter sp. WL0062]MCE5974808.1 ABC transporter permease subunit [Sinirhodobacter sp. WL0062]